MKNRLTITLDKETVASIESRLKEGSFRNKSHLIEYAVLKLLRGEQ